MKKKEKLTFKNDPGKKNFLQKERKQFKSDFDYV